MTDEMPLGRGAEFDAIRAMLARWGRRAAGVGDDAATFRAPRGDALVASVDSSVEGVHFKREWLSPREIGYRAVAAALSDLAAMAARPIGILVAITVPAHWRAALLDIADGIGDAVDVAETRVLGGNLSGGTELSLTTTVFGSAFAPLARNGARAGDAVYLTGLLGGPGEALRRLSAGHSPGDYRDRFARPVPRLAESRWLAELGASAAIDLSDGLLGDLAHLAAASGVCIQLDARAIPVVHGVERDAAMRSGEEYEIVVSSPVAFDGAVFEARFGIPLTKIGRVTDGAAGAIEVGGALVAAAAGHDHFSH